MAISPVPAAIKGIECCATHPWFPTSTFHYFIKALPGRPNAVHATDSQELIDVLFIYTMQQASEKGVAAFLESGRVSPEGINRAYLTIDWFHKEDPAKQAMLKPLFCQNIAPESTLYKTQETAINALRAGRFCVREDNGYYLLREAVALGLSDMALIIAKKCPYKIDRHIQHLDKLCNKGALVNHFKRV